VVGESGHAGLVRSFTRVSFDADADANSVVHSCTGAVAEPHVEGRVVLAARVESKSDSEACAAPAPS
jgi:hypothetical protein